MVVVRTPISKFWGGGGGLVKDVSQPKKLNVFDLDSPLYVEMKELLQGGGETFLIHTIHTTIVKKGGVNYQTPSLLLSYPKKTFETI